MASVRLTAQPSGSRPATDLTTSLGWGVGGLGFGEAALKRSRETGVWRQEGVSGGLGLELGEQELVCSLSLGGVWQAAVDLAGSGGWLWAVPPGWAFRGKATQSQPTRCPPGLWPPRQ